MSTILFAWELGGALGHVMRLAPLANALAQGGHRVFAALRNPALGTGLLDPAVRVLPAPARTKWSAPPLKSVSFAEVMSEAGFGDWQMLRSCAGAWRDMYNSLMPDVIVFDHSPTALLAARACAARRVVIGTGFTLPPDLLPFPGFKRGARIGMGDLVSVERPILDNANRVLLSWGRPALQRLGQLYGDADESLLCTFAELDVYRRLRPEGTRYVGPIHDGGSGAAPRWPEGDGPRVFAYLKPFRALGTLLRFLAERRLPTLLYAPSLPKTAMRAAPNIQFVSEALDVTKAAECDLAILNGGHGTAASVLLAGRPALHVPLSLEQALNARAVRRLGAGLDAPPNDRVAVASRLEELLLHRERYADAAALFAARYADFDAEEQREWMLDRIERAHCKPGQSMREGIVARR